MSKSISPVPFYQLKSKAKSPEEFEESVRATFGHSVAQMRGYIKKTEFFSEFDADGIPILTLDEMREAFSLNKLNPFDFLNTKEDIHYFKVMFLYDINKNSENSCFETFRDDMGTKYERELSWGHHEVRLTFKVGVRKERIDELIHSGELRLLPDEDIHEGYPLNHYPAELFVDPTKHLIQMAKGLKPIEAQFLRLTFKGKPFTLKPENRTMLTLLGFEYFKDEQTWEMITHVFSIKYFYLALKQVLPRWNQLSLHYHLIPSRDAKFREGEGTSFNAIENLSPDGVISPFLTYLVYLYVDPELRRREYEATGGPFPMDDE